MSGKITLNESVIILILVISAAFNQRYSVCVMENTSQISNVTYTCI